MTCYSAEAWTFLQQYNSSLLVLENLVQDKSNNVKMISDPPTFTCLTTCACIHVDIIALLDSFDQGICEVYHPIHAADKLQSFFCKLIRHNKHRGCVFVRFSLWLNSSLTRDQFPPPVSTVPPLVSIYSQTIPLQSAVSEDKHGLIMIHYPEAYMQVEKQDWRSYFSVWKL